MNLAREEEEVDARFRIAEEERGRELERRIASKEGAQRMLNRLGTRFQMREVAACWSEWYHNYNKDVNTMWKTTSLKLKEDLETLEMTFTQLKEKHYRTTKSGSAKLILNISQRMVKSDTYDAFVSWRKGWKNSVSCLLGMGGMIRARNRMTTQEISAVLNKWSRQSTTFRIRTLRDALKAETREHASVTLELQRVTFELEKLTTDFGQATMVSTITILQHFPHFVLYCASYYA